MNAFGQLDELLSSDEDEYFSGDWFLEAEEEIALLGDADLSDLLAVWKVRDESWRGRFAQASARISHDVLLALLRESLSASIEPSTIFELMGRLPQQADDSELCDSLVEYSARVWHEQALTPVRIQMGAWNCGLSGRLLRRLGFRSWKDAGL